MNQVNQKKYIPPGESNITNGCGNITGLLLWGGGFPLELLWGFKGVLLVVPID
jgi:hypothetical protein